MSITTTPHTIWYTSKKSSDKPYTILNAKHLAFAIQDLTHRELCLYLWLSRYQLNHKFPFVPAIYAKWLGRDVTTVRKSLLGLTNKGYIRFIDPTHKEFLSYPDPTLRKVPMPQVDNDLMNFKEEDTATTQE